MGLPNAEGRLSNGERDHVRVEGGETRIDVPLEGELLAAMIAIASAICAMCSSAAASALGTGTTALVAPAMPLTSPANACHRTRKQSAR